MRACAYFCATVVLSLSTARADDKPTPEVAALHLQVARLKVGQAAELRKEGQYLKAAHYYLQGAQAFESAGDEEGRKALIAGTQLTESLRGAWLHPRGCEAMAFLEGNRQVVTCGKRGDVVIWDAKRGTQVRAFQLEDPPNSIVSVAGMALSSDRYKALFWMHSTVQLWDLLEGKLLQSFPGGSPARGAAFAREDESAVLLWSDSKAWLYEIGKDKPYAELEHKTIHSSDVTLSADRKLVASSNHSAAILYETVTGKQLQRFETNETNKLDLPPAFTPDQKQLLVFGGDDALLRLFDIENGKLVRTFQHPQSAGRPPNIVRAYVSPRGDRIASWSTDGVGCIWNLATGERLDSFERARRSLSFSADGAMLLTTEAPARLRDATTGKIVNSYDTATDARLLPDGKQVVLWERGKPNAALWDVYRSVPVRIFDTQLSVGKAVASDDSQLLLVAEESVGFGNDVVGVWLWCVNPAPPYERTSVPEGERAGELKHEKRLQAVDVAANGKEALTLDREGTLRRWNVAERRELESRAIDKETSGIAYSADAKRFATWATDVQVWDVGAEKPVATLKHPAPVRGAVFGSDGEHLLTWDENYTVRWWRVGEDKPLGEYAHRRYVFGAKLNAASTLIASHSADGTVMLWDTAANKVRHVLEDKGPVVAVHFTPDDHLWTSRGGELQKWDLAEGKIVDRFAPDKGAGQFEFAADGERVLLTNRAGFYEYWHVAGKKQLAKLTHEFNIYGYFEGVKGARLNDRGDRAVTWAGNTMYLWDLTSGLRLRTMRASGEVRGATFMDDSTKIFAWTDLEAALWNAGPARLSSVKEALETLEARSGLRIGPDGKFIKVPRDEWQTLREKHWKE
jgi:WD40 repeat protein